MIYPEWLCDYTRLSLKVTGDHFVEYIDLLGNPESLITQKTMLSLSCPPMIVSK